jgi:hypothetical protein
MTAVTQAVVPQPPKRILVNGRKIHLRWLQQIIWSFVAANVGAFIISALYYLFVQLRWQVGGHTLFYLKHDWDYLFSFRGWKSDRHDIRNVYEAVLATLFVKSLLANWRKRGHPAPAWYVAISPFLIVIVAAPFVIAGVWLINHALPYLWHLLLAHRTVHNPIHFPHSWAWLGTYLSGYPWQPLVIGVLTGLVVHRVFAPAGNAVQLYFIGRSVDRARDAASAGEPNPQRHLPRWPWPPVIRERAAWIMETNTPVPDRHRDITWAVWFMIVVLGALAIYGGYVRLVIARHAA